MPNHIPTLVESITCSCHISIVLLESYQLIIYLSSCRENAFQHQQGGVSWAYQEDESSCQPAQGVFNIKEEGSNYDFMNFNRSRRAYHFRARLQEEVGSDHSPFRAFTLRRSSTSPRGYHHLGVRSRELKGKGLWDPDFDVPAHGEAFFLPSEDKARLMVHDEDHLLHDALKLSGKHLPWLS